ncbi:hypothetical protein WG926_02585 [Tistrella sp. BH-R2-4]|uniref:Uncharacterized protein n=1 Tax=Tistrella arctica TaxID=3133430 RepID=A0ABU9YEG1_9PROT
MKQVILITGASSGKNAAQIGAVAAYAEPHTVDLRTVELDVLPVSLIRWIVKLAEPESSWVTGQVIGADGGLGL